MLMLLINCYIMYYIYICVYYTILTFVCFSFYYSTLPKARRLFGPPQWAYMWWYYVCVYSAWYSIYRPTTIQQTDSFIEYRAYYIHTIAYLLHRNLIVDGNFNAKKSEVNTFEMWCSAICHHNKNEISE